MVPLAIWIQYEANKGSKSTSIKRIQLFSVVPCTYNISCVRLFVIKFRGFGAYIRGPGVGVMCPQDHLHTYCGQLSVKWVGR